MPASVPHPEYMDGYEEGLKISEFNPSYRYNFQMETGEKSPRFFDEDSVRARLRMSDLIKALEQALVEFSEEESSSRCAQCSHSARSVPFSG